MNLGGLHRHPPLSSVKKEFFTPKNTKTRWWFQRFCMFISIWVFPKIAGYPKMDGKKWKTLLKWMIWVVKNPPIFGSTPIWGFMIQFDDNVNGWVFKTTFSRKITKANDGLKVRGKGQLQRKPRVVVQVFCWSWSKPTTLPETNSSPMKIPSFLVNTIKMVDFPASYVSLQECIGERFPISNFMKHN